MKSRLVPFLACPDCGGDLRLEAQSEVAPDGEIVEGALGCAGCARTFRIARGVPRLVPRAVGGLSVEVAAGFGWEWNRFDELRPEYHQQFLDWIRPLGPDDFVGKRVLDGGCGKGRHAALAAGYGAAEVFALDLGSAVEAAFRNTRHLRAVHVIQGDLLHPPLKRCVDLAYSVGVLHHLPDPEPGFRAIVGKLVDGGRIVVWVYGHEGNEWIVRFVDPIRMRISSKIPRHVLYEVARPLGWLVAGAAKGLYRPLAESGSSLARFIGERLFYRDYLTYVAKLPTREIHSIVFDQLVTPVAHYLRREEVERWFGDPRLEGAVIEQHNANSWRGNARIKATAQKVPDKDKEIRGTKEAKAAKAIEARESERVAAPKTSKKPVRKHETKRPSNRPKKRH